jgi:Asp-tRNA(Asn)/Glu-tRNA(Gln) amidotransferase A subunit family amidase
MRRRSSFAAMPRIAARVHSLCWNDLRFMSSINVLGLPAAVVPVGQVNGHPVGVQLIASRYREDLCLDAAAAIEAKVGSWQSSSGSGAEPAAVRIRRHSIPLTAPPAVVADPFLVNNGTND